MTLTAQIQPRSAPGKRQGFHPHFPHGHEGRPLLVREANRAGFASHRLEIKAFSAALQGENVARVKVRILQLAKDLIVIEHVEPALPGVGIDGRGSKEDVENTPGGVLDVRQPPRAAPIHQAELQVVLQGIPPGDALHQGQGLLPSHVVESQSARVFDHEVGHAVPAADGIGLPEVGLHDPPNHLLLLTQVGATHDQDVHDVAAELSTIQQHVRVFLFQRLAHVGLPQYVGTRLVPRGRAERPVYRIRAVFAPEPGIRQSG